MKKLYSNLLPKNTDNDTDEFFSNFFSGEDGLTENELSAVIAFFERRAENKIAANAIAMSVIYVSYISGTKVMEVLEQFKSMSDKQIDEYLAYFMNISRYPSSAVGVTSIPTMSKYVKRAIIP